MADSDEENEDLTMYDEEAKFDMFGNLITQDHHMPTMEDVRNHNIIIVIIIIIIITIIRK